MLRRKLSVRELTERFERINAGAVPNRDSDLDNVCLDALVCLESMRDCKSLSLIVDTCKDTTPQKPAEYRESFANKRFGKDCVDLTPYVNVLPIIVDDCNENETRMVIDDDGVALEPDDGKSIAIIRENGKQSETETINEHRESFFQQDNLSLRVSVLKGIAEKISSDEEDVEDSTKRLSKSDSNLSARPTHFVDSSYVETFTENTLTPNHEKLPTLELPHPRELSLSQSDNHLSPETTHDSLCKDPPFIQSLETVLSRRKTEPLPPNELHLTIQESLDVERNYIETLRSGIANYVHQFDIPQSQQMPPIPAKLKGQKYHIFRNIERMLAFHEDVFYPAIKSCGNDVNRIAHKVREFFKVFI